MMAGGAPDDWVVSPDGDAACVLTWPARLDPDINARAVAVAEALRRQRMPGVRDVVEAYATVTVHFDPLAGDSDEIADRLRRLAAEAGALAAAAADRPRREVRLPVVYGGVRGPDLADVARFADCSEADVIACHCRAAYRVYMIGFQPGFAYMGAVDPRIAAPRRSAPRLQVPTGSVGIAGPQTGVYPVASPGGWQLIGRTPVRLFDMTRRDPFLLASGDRVRFEPVDEAAYDRLEAGRE